MPVHRSTKLFVLLILLAALALAACDGATATPTSGTGGGSVDHVWYVELTGDDDNTCDTGAAPCLTIEGALAKAFPGDEIYVGEGTFYADDFDGYGTQINQDISIIGAGIDRTIVDGEDARIVFSVYEGEVSIRNMTIQHGGGSLGGYGVYSPRPFPRADLRLVNVRVQDNAGWGIEAASGFELEDSVVRRNGEGGVVAGGTIRNSQIVNNSGNAIYVSGGTLSVIDTTIFGHNFSNGPGLFATSADVTIEGSTFYDNTNTNPSGGGIVQVQGGSLTMVNSTVSGNTGTGIAMTTPGVLDITFSTIVENSGDGVYSVDVTGRFQNNLLSNGGALDCDLRLSGLGLGLDRADNISVQGPVSHCRGIHVEDVMVDALADNGGPTLTRALQPGSPAIDAAGDCVDEDQTDAMRPIGLACDVGAFEAAGFTMSGELPADEEGPGEVIVVPDQNYNCRYGAASSVFDIADTLYGGEEYKPIGVGADGLWLQFEGPSFGELCWAPSTGFTLYVDGEQVDISALVERYLEIVAYPPIPTATPTPTFTPEPAQNQSGGQQQPTATPTCTPQQQQNQQCP